MDVPQELIVVAAAIWAVYAAECVNVLRATEATVASGLGLPFVLGRGRFQVRMLLPWGLAFVVDGFRLGWSDKAVFAYQHHRVSPRRPSGWGWRRLPRPVQAKVGIFQDEVRVDGQRFVDQSSGPLARILARRLARIVRGGRADIEDLSADEPRTGGGEGAPIGDSRGAEASPGAQIVAEVLDVAAVRERVGEVKRAIWPLRIACIALFAYVLAVLAQLALDFTWVRAWPRWGGGALLLWGMVLVEFWIAHAAVHPEDSGDRIQKLFAMVLAPPGAIRAVDRVCRDALGGYHRLAVVAALASPARLERLAREEVRSLRHPRREPWLDDDPAAAEDQRWFASFVSAPIDAVVRAAGLDPEALLVPPGPAAADDHRYCPACHDVYEAHIDECADCGVPLADWAPPPPG